MGSRAGKGGDDQGQAGALRLEPERHASFLIVALANRISASASHAYMRQFGVGVMEWRALALLARTPGISANQIAHASGIDKSSVSRAVQSLIRRGFVRSREDKADNRRALLFLTPLGLELHDRIIRSSLAREALLLTGLSEDERGLLFGLLKRLTANMALVSAHDPAADDS